MSTVTLDTSALVAAVVGPHEHHDVAAAALARADVVVANCLAELWSVLSRGAFRLPSETVDAVVAGLRDRFDHELVVEVPDYDRVFDRAGVLRLAGDVHDAAISALCGRTGVQLLTLDRGQHALAQSFGAHSELLL